MKKLILLLITLTTFTNVTYASFPITSNNTSEASTTISFQDPDDDEEEDPSWWILIYILNFIIIVGGFFLLLRMWWRAWKNRVKWVRIFTKIVLILVGLLTLLTIICSIEGCIYNMQ